MSEAPLTLSRKQAAALLSLSPSGFDSWVRRGIIPTAIMGTRRWSRATIERAVNGKAANDAFDPDEVQKRYMALSPFEQWEAGHRTKRPHLPDEQSGDPPRRLGKREREVLLALAAAGGSVDDATQLPNGPATLGRLW